MTLRILSGSENQEPEGILDDFARERGVNIEMEYQGSLDIMRTLQGETVDYDAVWPASSLWLTAGDTQYRVKHAQSISITPVVFGIRQGLAEELGFVGTEVSVSDLLSAIQAGELEFCMTSATQSNSGCSAYIGFLYALLGNPDVITSESLQTPGLSEQITRLRVQRAMELLATTSLSNVEISRLTGFSDYNYFYRVFRRQTGLTPRRYRTSMVADT